MSIISPPGEILIRRIEWQLKQPAQVNRSWTGHRQVVGLPGGAIWTATGELVPILRERNVRAWRAFFISLRGQLHSFYLPAVEEDQHAYPNVPLVKGGGQSGRTLLTDGWPASVANIIPAGAMVSIGGTDQLVMLTQPVNSNGAGEALLTFEAALRAIPGDNAVLQTKRPRALVSLTSDTTGWTVDQGQIYGISFSVEEAY